MSNWFWPLSSKSNDIDEDEFFSWPTYVASLRHRLRCDSYVLVVTQSETDNDIVPVLRAVLKQTPEEKSYIGDVLRSHRQSRETPPGFRKTPSP
ncbi:MAG TPA: hypothetical protein VIV60_21310 [Polyangiaceae bacterium]